MTDIHAWAEQQAYYREGYTGKHYSPYVCHIMNMYDERIRKRECGCEWASPYGFVVEAGCKQHDSEEQIAGRG